MNSHCATCTSNSLMYFTNQLEYREKRSSLEAQWMILAFSMQFIMWENGTVTVSDGIGPASMSQFLKNSQD